MKHQVRVGTSGWHYKHWKNTFYPPDTKDAGQLGYYITRFDTVELNNSFYRLPKASVFADWEKAVPAHFLFAVKANRYITHLKKLNPDEGTVEQFLDNVAALGNKLGPILFQLPPGWKMNLERFEHFISRLPKGYQYTFEFRNHTWYHEDIYRLLQQYNMAFCIYELAYHLSPLQVTADFVYVRLHGPGDKYQGSYTDEVLRTWAERCKAWRRHRKDVYVYFDNDQHGYAAFNALRLQELLNT
jgi:uncharacterized protein YecE (DUF72 family)